MGEKIRYDPHLTRLDRAQEIWAEYRLQLLDVYRRRAAPDQVLYWLEHLLQDAPSDPEKARSVMNRCASVAYELSLYRRLPRNERAHWRRAFHRFYSNQRATATPASRELEEKSVAIRIAHDEWFRPSIWTRLWCRITRSAAHERSE